MFYVTVEDTLYKTGLIFQFPCLEMFDGMFELSKPYQTTKQSMKQQEKPRIKRIMANEEKPFSEQLR